VGVFAPPDGALTLTLGALAPLPTAAGTYSLLGSGLFDFLGGTLQTSPVGTLDITGTPVPEPRSAIVLFSIALAALSWKRRKRLA
jgi:hypothetical protein